LKITAPKSKPEFSYDLKKLQTASLKSRPTFRAKLQTVQILKDLCQAISVTVYTGFLSAIYS